MKIYVVAGMVLLVSHYMLAQVPAEKEEIMVPIKALFKGMTDGDSALVHSAFVKDPSFSSVSLNKAGKPVLRPERLEHFLKAVGTAHDESWNEPIWDVKIEQDGNFAQVWADYAFYLEKKFSHCGIDAFHLFRGENGRWRIFNLSDTRRTEGCKVPASVSDQYK